MKIIVLILFSISILFAHPHTYIDVHTNIIKVEKNQTTIKFDWVLDDMTSSMLIMDFDQNGDGKIDKKENDFVYNEYFKTLGEYSFYTDIKVKDKLITFPKIKMFKSSIKDNKIVYSFTIDIDSNIKNIKLSMYDEDFFVAMILKKEFIKANGVSFSIKELDEDFYFGYSLEFN